MKLLSGRRFKEVRNRLLIGATGCAVKLLWLTVRFEVRGFEETKRAGWGQQGVILVLWHNCLLLPLGHECRRGSHAIVSAGRDGDFAARVLRRWFGVGAFRGSSSRRGAAALLEMIRERAAGASLALTPDGPRGPRYTFGPSSAWLAARSGLAVVPIGGSVSRAWYLKSWDRFRIPKPFSRVVLVFGPPQRVDPEEARVGLEEARQRLHEALNAASREAAEATGESWPDAQVT